MKTKNILIILLAVIILSVGLYLIYYNLHYPYSGNAPEFGEEDLECGCYYGSYTQKKPETPSNWEWEDSGKSSVWYNPESSCCLFER